MSHRPVAATSTPMTSACPSVSAVQGADWPRDHRRRGAWPWDARAGPSLPCSSLLIVPHRNPQELRRDPWERHRHRQPAPPRQLPGQAITSRCSATGCVKAGARSLLSPSYPRSLQGTMPTLPVACDRIDGPGGVASSGVAEAGMVPLDHRAMGVAHVPGSLWVTMVCNPRGDDLPWPLTPGGRRARRALSARPMSPQGQRPGPLDTHDVWCLMTAQQPLVTVSGMCPL
jgi:hypothetical protein